MLFKYIFPEGQYVYIYWATEDQAHAVLLLPEGFLSLAGSKLSYVKLINLEDIRLYFGADRIEIMNGKEYNNIRQFKL